MLPKLGGFYGSAASLNSTLAPSHEEILDAYQSHELAEKIFDVYKNASGDERLYTGSDQPADGLVFFTFVSLTLRAPLEYKLREASRKSRLNVPEGRGQAEENQTTRPGRRRALAA